MSTILLIAGPESSATRFWASVFSKHSMVMGTDDGSHADVLDPVWNHENWPEINKPFVVTRRSIPHGKNGGSARYMDFPDIASFLGSAENQGHQIKLLIPTRAVIPHLVSWVDSRNSCAGEFGKALNQYHWSYESLLGLANEKSLEWYFLSLEALLYDRAAYIQTLMLFLGLPPEDFEFDVRNPNQRRYVEFMDALAGDGEPSQKETLHA